MKIETKYSIGDKVFLIDDNKIHQVEVYGVFLEAKAKQSPIVAYTVQIEYVSQWHKKEYELFDTKEDLIKTL